MRRFGPGPGSNRHQVLRGGDDAACQAEAAARRYVAIFANAKIGRNGSHGNEGREIHGKEAGSVMTVEFELKAAFQRKLN
jgi:predicted 3-demethylubiquinone-9 3-methyltransferase (glyoxalase superfamily)